MFIMNVLLSATQFLLCVSVFWDYVLYLHISSLEMSDLREKSVPSFVLRATNLTDSAFLFSVSAPKEPKNKIKRHSGVLNLPNRSKAVIVSPVSAQRKL